MSLRNHIPMEFSGKLTQFHCISADKLAHSYHGLSTKPFLSRTSQPPSRISNLRTFSSSKAPSHLNPHRIPASYKMHPYMTFRNTDKRLTQSHSSSLKEQPSLPSLYYGDVESFDCIVEPTASAKDIPSAAAIAASVRRKAEVLAQRKRVELARRKKEELTRLKKAVKEAKDACLWLKAAGFPQYVQMYEDGQFPINLSKFQVEKDHYFLDQADIESLKRRLNILNLCADKMDEIRSRRRGSNEDVNCRALSDKWQFRRRQKKWSRRNGSSSKSTAEYDTLFSSSEDLVEDNTEADGGSPNDYSPLMLVSELSNSLTGLDQAVKTYSFMLNEDKVPTIQVEGPQLVPKPATSRDLLQMSSAFSSFESEEEEEEGLINGEKLESFPFPSSSIDNFATGILDAFEYNMLKFKTQSLPDIFKPTSEYSKVNVSSDVSPLSSTSNSITSIDPMDSSYSHQGVTHAVYPRSHPLADHRTFDPTSPRNNVTTAVDTEVEWVVRDAHEQRRLAHPSADEGRKMTMYKMNGAGGARHNRMCSGDSLGTCSLAGSEFSEKDYSGFSSSSPIPTSRLPVIPNGFSGGDHSFHNGKEHIHISRGDVSPLEELTKRISRVSVSSVEPHKKHEARWHSYQRPHSYRAAFRPVRTLIPIEELSVGQITVLKKLSLIKVTSLIELHRTKTNINITKLLKMKKKKLTDARKRKVFGLSLSMNIRVRGKALPQAILNAMEHLQKDSNLETKGLFRRAASKSKVDALKELVEENPDYSDFADFSPYDVADMIKLYFRELPEPILTSKLSEILIMIQQSVPNELRLPALQGVMLMIPDEHREALQVLLLFLKLVAKHSAMNQMTPQNLAVCFSPTLFSLSNTIKATTSLNRRSSFKRTAVSLVLTPEQIAANKEITESVASSHCLTGMICEADKMFKIAADMLHVCRFTHLEMGDPVPYYELGLDRRGSGNLYSYLDSCVHTVLWEARRKFKGWVHVDTLNGVDVSSLKPNDGVPLQVWRGVVEVDASSANICQRMWNDRSLWHHDVLSPKLVTKIDEQTEVFQYSSPCMPPLANRDHCLLRSWQFNVATGSFVMVSTSVSHPLASLQGGIRAMHLVTFYLIEPLDSDHSRLSYLCRVDMRGRSVEFYNKYYGPYLASTVSRVRDILSSGLIETSV